MSALVKCLVWDLDNTVWSGVLAEGDDCALRPGVGAVLRRIDERGVLNSVASANDEETARRHLHRLGIADYFLAPRIGWGEKTESVRRIMEELGVSPDATGFVDDEPFERAQMQALLPTVRVYDADRIERLPQLPEFSPVVLTEESRNRRRMYQQERVCAEAEQRTGLSHMKFLRSCQTVLAPRAAMEADIPRILELLQRTHQLNATGVVYGGEAVRRFVTEPDFRVYVASLRDRFVNYGRIAVAVCRCTPPQWTILSCLLSCRVLRRGVGTAFVGWIEMQAHAGGASEISARFVPGPRNRPMLLLYTMSGFVPGTPAPNGDSVLSRRCRPAIALPEWLTLGDGSSS